MQTDIQLWRWAAILLLSGGIIFWTGALTPPYKWWMTKDTGEYLTLIDQNKLSWYFIAGTFLVGIILSLSGIQLASTALREAGQKILPQIAITTYFTGTIFWILNIAFRITVTVWAAQQLKETGHIEPTFKTWMDWTNLIFAIYMVLAYFAIGCLGYSLLQVNLLPGWVSWTCIIMGFGGSVLYLVRFPFFDPPLMVHTPLIILAIMILMKIK